MRKVPIPAAVIFAMIVVFAISSYVGRRFRNQRPAVTSEPVSTQLADDQRLHDLPQVVAASGIRLIAGVEGSRTFVHPQSPCWLDVPGEKTEVSIVRSGESPGYLGAQVCSECHQQRFSDFVQTAHYKASSLPTAESILGSFEPNRNQLTTNHPDLRFEMSKEGEGEFFQNVWFRELRKKFRFDIVTGAGNVGQTYLYWYGDALYQLHVSYFRDVNAWTNSPGFHDGTAWYAREVTPKCVECHTTYMEFIPSTTNQYRQSETILGISCERCHGPGRDHVAYHREFPNERKAMYTLNPSDLAREQKNDVCAQCHFGSGARKQPPFRFRPGDRVNDFWDVVEDTENMEGGVHSSNQLARLKLSKCFANSEAMACTDCHNPHKNERGDVVLFSQKCIKCHQPKDCGKFPQLGDKIGNNCIDCHMTMGQDKHLAIETPHSVRFPLLRDHYIRILQEASERFIDELSTNRRGL